MERPRKQYNVQLEDDVIERVDKLAEKFELNRSQILRNFILMGLEDAEILNKTGVLTVIKIGREIRQKFIEDILGGKLILGKKGWEIAK
jgi:predicted DNA-binding protein